MVNVGIIGAGRIGKVHVESICTQVKNAKVKMLADPFICLLYTSPSPRDRQKSRMPSSA